MKPPLSIILLFAIVTGISIAYIDTRPHWNDDGISVLMLLAVSFFCGMLSNGKIWLIALNVGIWTPLFNILLDHNYGSLLALTPPFIGAYTGSFTKKAFSKS